jgi:hypothetical protein
MQGAANVVDVGERPTPKIRNNPKEFTMAFPTPFGRQDNNYGRHGNHGNRRHRGYGRDNNRRYGR